MEFALHWHDTFLFLWFVFTLSVSVFKNYKHALIANITATSCFTLYALFIHEPVAASMTAIAAASGMIQLLIPSSNERKFVIVRNGIAVTAALAACALLYQKPADIFPCLSTCVTRIGEAQQSAKIMKMAMIAATLIWSVFGVMTELYLMTAMRFTIAAVFIYKLFFENKNDAPIVD